MRMLILLLGSLMLVSCVTTEQKLTRADLAIYEKKFKGQIVSKSIEEFDEEEDAGLFGSSKLSLAFQIEVEAPDGTKRKFFDYTSDPLRMRVLKQYNRDFQKDDAVIINLGIVDDKKPEERFDSISLGL